MHRMAFDRNKSQDSSVHDATSCNSCMLPGAMPHSARGGSNDILGVAESQAESEANAGPSDRNRSEDSGVHEKTGRGSDARTHSIPHNIRGGLYNLLGVAREPSRV